MDTARNLAARTAGWAAAAIFVVALAGCSEDLEPEISLLQAQPACVVLPEAAGSAFADVTFVMRATGGNVFGDPTGANIPVKVVWDFGDGQTANDASLVVHRYTQPGSFPVTVRVEDKDGDTAEQSITVDVKTVDQAITVEPTTTITEGFENGVLVGYDVRFVGGANYACASSALDAQFSFEWDFDDGSPSVRGPVVTHRYPLGTGPYDVVVTATVLNTGVAKQHTIVGLTLP